MIEIYLGVIYTRIQKKKPPRTSGVFSKYHLKIIKLISIIEENQEKSDNNKETGITLFTLTNIINVILVNNQNIFIYFYFI